MATDCHFSDTRALNNGEDVIIIMIKIEGGGEGGGRSRRDGTVVLLEFLPAATQVYTLVGFHRQSLFGQQLIHWFLMTNVTTCDKCDLM